jgi:hypothetical protein
MYNTDRLIGYDFHGGIEFVEIPGSFEPRGKEWARGYVTDYPNPLYDVGTRFGRHPWDLFTFLSAWDLLPGLLYDLHTNRKEAGVKQG